MRYLLYIFLFIHYFISSNKIIACNNNNESLFTYNDKYIKIEALTKLEYDKYSDLEYQYTIDTSRLIKSKDDILKFTIDSSNPVIFKDTLLNTDNAERRINRHIGDLLDYYIIQTEYYESSECILLNKHNGLRYNLISTPLLSPSNKYILSYGGSLGYVVMPSQMQLWKIIDNGLINIFDLNLDVIGFEIEEIRWITDKKVALKIGFGTSKYAYGLMKIK